MINYRNNIFNSGLSIYDDIDPSELDLYIPTKELECILNEQLFGLRLEGLPLRTRSKVVKKEICKALGYPIPSSFKKTQPRFPGQNFDVYTQKSMNVQIWNEEIDANRRYVFLRINDEDVVTKVRVITGEELAHYDRTGTLTQKYQATMRHYGDDICSDYDTPELDRWISNRNLRLNRTNPNTFPTSQEIRKVRDLYELLAPMVGTTIDYLDAIQERNRGDELHRMICEKLGYSVLNDNGKYPDVTNQLLEIKLQTSPTIDLGLHSPLDGQIIGSVEDMDFYSIDVRYAIFDGEVIGNKVLLKRLYLVTGYDFTDYFPLFEGNKVNKKIQLPLPYDFFS